MGGGGFGSSFPHSYYQKKVTDNNGDYNVMSLFNDDAKALVEPFIQEMIRYGNLFGSALRTPEQQRAHEAESAIVITGVEEYDFGWIAATILNDFRRPETPWTAW